MSESLVDDYAANRAILTVRREHLLKLIWRSQFNCNRAMAVKDFADWLADFQSDSSVQQERLIRRAERTFKEIKGNKKKILVKGPLVLKVLKKIAT